MRVSCAAFKAGPSMLANPNADCVGSFPHIDGNLGVGEPIAVHEVDGQPVVHGQRAVLAARAAGCRMSVVRLAVLHSAVLSRGHTARLSSLR